MHKNIREKVRLEDKLFRDCLKLSFVPSEEILRQRLDGIAADENTLKLIDDANVELLSGVNDFGVETTAYSTYNVIDIDIDVSVLDNSNSKKAGVSWTYQEVDGYAPIFAHLGTHGYMLANELRNGSQHSAKNASAFVRRCNDLAKRIGVENILYRVDSGHDDVEFLEPLVDPDEATCINLYHNYATSEQFHNELKMDMDIEKLPSGKFRINALFLSLGTLAYNCLRIFGQRALKVKELLLRNFDVTRRCLRSVMQYLICVGCKIVSHTNSKIMKFGRRCPYFNVIQELYARC